VTIRLNLLPHSSFSLRTSPVGADLVADISITLSESLLGFDRLILTHLDGRGLRVRQPGPGELGYRILRQGDVLKIRNEGLPVKRGSNAKGDLYLKVDIEQVKEDHLSSLSPRQLSVSVDAKSAFASRG
jgi:DnaJ family protein A protein 2